MIIGGIAYVYFTQKAFILQFNCLNVVPNNYKLSVCCNYIILYFYAVKGQFLAA